MRSSKMSTLQPKDPPQTVTKQAVVIRKCCRCGQIKDIDEFLLILQDGERTYNGMCMGCAKAIKARNKEQARNKGIRYRLSLRKEIINAYGGMCACCGESEPQFLAIDHIYNDGAKHRRKVNDLYRWLKRQGYPKDHFQLLCHNCNLAKAFYGQCPHSKNAKPSSCCSIYHQQSERIINMQTSNQNQSQRSAWKDAKQINTQAGAI